MTVLISVLGIVQGVGYRPFVARLAQEFNITGTVMNYGGIVEITADGEEKAIDDFVHCLKLRQPYGADVLQIKMQNIPERHFADFKIVLSRQSAYETPLIPPDLPMCDNCKRELYDPDDRRYRYPFISCVACGPRYSIINALPYDRETTTMQSFPMCQECEQEYTNHDNARCHAQTISCHDCGPQLILHTDGKEYHGDEALIRGIQLIWQGSVLAIKGIGGYQFACLPTDVQAVENLRQLKHRDKKPFAVMFPSLQMIKDYCQVNEKEEKLLTSSARPIVLLQKKKDDFCTGVSGESRFIGAFLPYTALHQLLTDDCGALVMTSGNLTSEPIITQDDDMLSLRSPYLSGVLYNKRNIVTPLDDSVTRVVCGKVQILRRSRGYVPLPVLLEKSAEKPVLAMGGDLKSSFCLYVNNRAYLSQYFGDTDNYHVLQVYGINITRMQDIFGIQSEIIACDMHPGYNTGHLTEKLAAKSGSETVKIQHHHAHAASVMAEHKLSSCIGVVFDGTGYGTDGAVWGGEFLLCKGAEYERCAHLDYVTLCGGDEASKNAELAASCYLYAAGVKFEGKQLDIVRSALENHIQTQRYSSMGRLFDAVSAVLNIKTQNSYEGECAIALENAAAAYEKSGEPYFPLHFKFANNGTEPVINQVELLKDIYVAYKSGVDRGALALGFHRAVVEMALAVCIHIRGKSGENIVALSGGVFANLIILQECVNQLESAGFLVCLNKEAPSNDGGICLGQAWLSQKMN